MSACSSAVSGAYVSSACGTACASLCPSPFFCKYSLKTVFLDSVSLKCWLSAGRTTAARAARAPHLVCHRFLSLRPPPAHSPPSHPDRHPRLRPDSSVSPLWERGLWTGETPLTGSLASPPPAPHPASGPLHELSCSLPKPPLPPALRDQTRGSVSGGVPCVPAVLAAALSPVT